jgi:hypothetical protein
MIVKGGKKKFLWKGTHQTIYGDNVLLHVLILCTIYAHEQFKISFLARLPKVNYHHQLLVVIPLTTKGWPSSIMVQLVHILSLPTHSDLTTSGVPSILIFSYLYLYRNNYFFLWRMYISCKHATQTLTELIQEIRFWLWKEEEMYRTKFGEY